MYTYVMNLKESGTLLDHVLVGCLSSNGFNDNVYRQIYCEYLEFLFKKNVAIAQWKDYFKEPNYNPSISSYNAHSNKK